MECKIVSKNNCNVVIKYNDVLVQIPTSSVGDVKDTINVELVNGKYILSEDKVPLKPMKTKVKKYLHTDETEFVAESVD